MTRPKSGDPWTKGLDPEPLRAAIQRDAQRAWDDSDISGTGCLPGRYPGIAILARQIGIGERQLRRMLSENQTASLSFADRYCVATNRHLSDLYPELYDWAPLEAGEIEATVAA